MLGKRGGGGEEASVFSLEEQVKEMTEEVKQLTLHVEKAAADENGARETVENVRRSVRVRGDEGEGEEHEEEAEAYN